MEKVTSFIEKDIIREEIKRLGRHISRDYSNNDLLVIGILKGAWVFMADLVREILISVECTFIKVSSYGYLTKSSGNIILEWGVNEDIKGKDILLVDCIADTGISLDFVKKYLIMKSPKSIKTCVLLNKQVKKLDGFAIEYVGFDVPDCFFVGYGLDYKNRFRELSYIGILTL